MNRRKFLSNSVTGIAVGPALLPSLPIAHASAGARMEDIDSERLSEAVYQKFIPGKLTCCESILMAGCAALGVKNELVPDIALGLAGGIGLQGKTCGVITGCAMVLSIAIAQKQKEYAKKKMATLQAVGRICDAFEKRVGSTECRTLCGLDLTTPEGRVKLQDSVKQETCTRFVKAGSELLATELQRL
jgi:C_GCAxxG_C_C family probable redox protein